VNIPNALSLMRLVLVPLVVALIGQGQWFWAFALFVLCGVTDAIDGFIAKRYGMQTELGSYLDPIADKALLISIYVTLALKDVLPDWLAIVVVSRDLMIIGGVILAWIVDRPIPINPLWLGKANTVVQILFAAMKLAFLAFGISSPLFLAVGMMLVTLLTLVSMGAYLAAWLRHMN
jgi:cardiolipin synthase